MFHCWTRVLTETCVEGWLATTRLVAGEFHANAKAVKNVHDGLASLRVERIDEARHKKLDMSHASIVIPIRNDFFCMPENLV